ncbi:MAG: tRNA pseudouridine(55) synthase TruB [Betaproteobacteria bacterium]|nr:tRNA pseudouridine(55) synthase TruB [Betaproteobacteria bacterium]
MQFKRIKRPISGVLLLDKPYGISSNGALQRAKSLYQAAKAGHTGNLDPIATGMLPICFGEATKFSQFLLDANKTYRAVFKLGQTTTTGDSEGEVTSSSAVAVSREQVEQALRQFVGTISQVPPMYSALKFQGKALYTYARAGIEIERAARQVTIYSLTLDAFAGDELTVTVECSKGTYIRVLAEDLGRALGCGAYMLALRRTRIGDFEIGQAATLEFLEALSPEDRDAQLLLPECLLNKFPEVVLDRDSAHYFRQGQSIWLPKQAHSEVVVVYDENRCLVGIGEITDDGKVAPKRLVVENAA